MKKRMLRDIEVSAVGMGCTSAQISLAWVMYRPFIVPIPGMRSDGK